MQPITGLHIASLIDPEAFETEIYHEDWHGPFPSERTRGYDIVFLTGLQPDFDRMRQLSYAFRRAGAQVVAGGSICTSFPEFAAGFFDSVCAGGVESVREVIADFRRGALQPIYRTRATAIADYSVDYGLFRRSGISPGSHLLEASRGCRFKCSFCVMPTEFGGHATYGLERLAATLDDAIRNAPLLSIRRWYPTVIFVDNNFSDDRVHMRRVASWLRADRRIRGWAALVTQDVLGDRELIRELARAKCMTLFVGIESLDRAFLRRYNKKQNLGRNRDVVDDIAFAEAQGIGIGYGYLFDPRHQTADEMERQIRAIADTPRLPMPVYLSVVAPLAGTACFWEDLAAGELAPNLRLRDLDGETICHRRLADDEARVVGFLERMFRRPWTVVSRTRILAKSLRRILRSGTLDPIHWYVIAAANLHCFVWSSLSRGRQRTYVAGTDVLDPQYFERPDDLSEEDRVRYFEPVALTDAEGEAMPWLHPYIPKVEPAGEPVELAAGD